MSIIYCLIALETKILVEYSEHKGNFDNIARSILKKVKSNTRSVFKYDERYHFNSINEDLLTFMCMREIEYSKDQAFSFLESVQSEFLNTFPTERINTPITYSLNSEFEDKIKEKMDFFNDKHNLNDDPVSKLKDGLIITKNAVIEATEELSMRGEKVSLIVRKAKELREESFVYRSTSSKVKQEAKIRNIKIIIASVILTLVILYILVTVFCGGFTWSDCLK